LLGSVTGDASPYAARRSVPFRLGYKFVTPPRGYRFGAMRSVVGPRSGARAVALAAAVTLIAGVRPAAGSPPAPPPAVLFPSRGAYLGARVQPSAGESEEQAIAALEQRIGRPLAVERIYHRWWDAFPTAEDVASARSGRLLFVSWSAMTARGMVTPWGDIASGAYDRWIRARADAVRALGLPLYLCFHHEPEDNEAFGTPSAFVAAYRHVVDLFREEGASNVAFVWTMMSASFGGDGAVAEAFYPGDSWVDAVGVDAYNWSPGRAGSRWRSFAEIVGPARRFALEHARPLVVPEFGAQEDPSAPGRKAAWLQAAGGTIHAWRDVKAVMYFDSSKGYPWRLASSGASLRAFAALGRDPWFDALPPLARIGASVGLGRVSGAAGSGNTSG